MKIETETSNSIDAGKIKSSNRIDHVMEYNNGFIRGAEEMRVRAANAILQINVPADHQYQRALLDFVYQLVTNLDIEK